MFLIMQKYEDEPVGYMGNKEEAIKYCIYTGCYYTEVNELILDEELKKSEINNEYGFKIEEYGGIKYEGKGKYLGHKKEDRCYHSQINFSCMLRITKSSYREAEEKANKVFEEYKVLKNNLGYYDSSIAEILNKYIKEI